MTRYEETLHLIEENCGHGKDNVISLATISAEQGKNGNPCPCVRNVDAHYENGVFYITTAANSNKMNEIAKNSEVAFTVNFSEISGRGIAVNLGWVLDPKNAAIRAKLRKTFSDWYDAANNEQNENCIILAVRITKVHIFKDHGAVHYSINFADRKEIT